MDNIIGRKNTTTSDINQYRDPWAGHNCRTKLMTIITSQSLGLGSDVKAILLQKIVEADL